MDKIKEVSFGILETVTKPLRGSGLRRIPAVAWLHTKVFKKLRPETAKVGDYTFSLDPLDSLGLLKGEGYEPFFHSVFEGAVRPTDIVCDLGANIGYYTLIKAKKIYAFEASPVNIPILKKNVEQNHVDAEVVPKAVTDKSGMATFYLFDRYGSGQHGLNDKQGEAISVETVSLDEFFPSGTKIDVIKMDIEGSEFNAWKGMQRLITENHDIKIFTEFCPRLLTLAGADPKDYLYDLERKGFRLRLLDEDRQKILEYSAKELGEMYTVEKDNLANILCSRTF